MSKVTQIEIARKLKLDVSSVNKILNRVEGPSFSEETVRRVFRVATKMGYVFERPNKFALLKALRKVFPEGSSDQDLAQLRNLPVEEVSHIRGLMLRAAGGGVSA